jgi:hypothetical protein
MRFAYWSQVGACAVQPSHYLQTADNEPSGVKEVDDRTLSYFMTSRAICKVLNCRIKFICLERGKINAVQVWLKVIAYSDVCITLQIMTSPPKRLKSIIIIVTLSTWASKTRFSVGSIVVTIIFTISYACAVWYDNLIHIEWSMSKYTEVNMSSGDPILHHAGNRYMVEQCNPSTCHVIIIKLVVICEK